MKRKGLIILVAVIAVLLIITLSVVGTYNGLIEKKETVDTATSEIDNQLQRRADLIPNFVATVKGYSDYEKSTFTAVTEARASASKASTVKEREQASAELDDAISVWVNAITEAYPELKADKQYIALQDELSGTENRIAVARRDYNASSKEYNVSIKKFPKNIIASIFGFKSYDYFKADEGTQSVPKVSFD